MLPPTPTSIGEVRIGVGMRTNHAHADLGMTPGAGLLSGSYCLDFAAGLHLLPRLSRRSKIRSAGVSPAQAICRRDACTTKTGGIGNEGITCTIGSDSVRSVGSYRRQRARTTRMRTARSS